MLILSQNNKQNEVWSKLTPCIHLLHKLIQFLSNSPFLGLEDCDKAWCSAIHSTIKFTLQICGDYPVKLWKHLHMQQKNKKRKDWGLGQCGHLLMFSQVYRPILKTKLNRMQFLMVKKIIWISTCLSVKSAGHHSINVFTGVSASTISCLRIEKVRSIFDAMKVPLEFTFLISSTRSCLTASRLSSFCPSVFWQVIYLRPFWPFQSFCCHSRATCFAPVYTNLYTSCFS